MNRWEGLDEFVAVAECGQFSAAAERLGLSTSQVSRQVARLEDRLQSRLFYRSTRRVALTEELRACTEIGIYARGPITDWHGLARCDVGHRAFDRIQPRHLHHLAGPGVWNHPVNTLQYEPRLEAGYCPPSGTAQKGVIAHRPAPTRG